MARSSLHRAALATISFALATPVAAQSRPTTPSGAARPYVVDTTKKLSAGNDSLSLAALSWREIGPYRGGRSVIATGSVVRPNEYYMGTVGGGVFKTIDGGRSWAPVTDKYFGGTIGAIAVAPSNPDVVYVGGGEYPIRGNVSHGEGMWKSTDGGKTWSSIGLRDTRQIARVVVNPTNPDIVYVGAFGHVWAPNDERGVFRSKDGGKTWDKVLFRNDSTGVSDLVMDPSNPNVLYATLWQAGRTPWLLSSGGNGSGMFKTTDGGDHWTEITRNAGLPAGIWGNAGLDISASKPSRVWALIEAKDGGLYRSDDAGTTWTKVNGENEIKQRAWYYLKVHADPKDTNVVYVNNVSFLKSSDGGKTFHPLRGLQHGDSHHLWIAPDDSKRMIETDDGGAEVTTDGGKTWTDEDYATGQFYHVIATTHFPYHVCGAQQDNSTMCGPSRSDGGIDISDWEDAGGGESGWIAARGDDPDIVYAGSYGAHLTRKDMHTGIEKNVNPWPDNPMGHAAADLKYRWQWTFPIIVSPHNSNVVYAGSNVVHKSTDNGHSWTVISPDLTYHDPATLGNSGGPLTKDQTSVEYYATVFIIAESPKTQGLIWTGSDDGKIYVTKNGGASWTDVTPKDMAKFTRVSSIDPSAIAEGTAYVAANRYQLDDQKPYLWKTTDYGRTWTRIDAGLPNDEFTRVLREDPSRRGLLVAGTERGVWYSPDDGKTWKSLQKNLPPVPVHDLVFKEGDIVAATHGRGFYIMDDIATLEQMADSVTNRAAYLFQPRDAYRVQWGGRRGGGSAQVTPENAPAHPVGSNPASGAIIQYWLSGRGHDVTLEFRDAAGNLIHSFSSKQDSAVAADSSRREALRRSREDSLRAAGLSADSIKKIARTVEAPSPSTDDGPGWKPSPAPRVPDNTGVNTFVWNGRYPEPSAFRGMILWAAGVFGPAAPPGTYQVRLIVDGKPAGTRSFKLLADPREKDVTPADYTEQFMFERKIEDRFSAANDAVKEIRWVRHELDDRKAKLPAAAQAEFGVEATALEQALGNVEDSLYQTQNRAEEDPLNYPIRLNNKIGALMFVVGGSDQRPTAQSYAVFNLLNAQLDTQLGRLKRTIDTMLPRVNTLLSANGQPKIEAVAKDVPVAASH